MDVQTPTRPSRLRRAELSPRTNAFSSLATCRTEDRFTWLPQRGARARMRSRFLQIDSDGGLERRSHPPAHHPRGTRLRADRAMTRSVFFIGEPGGRALRPWSRFWPRCSSPVHRPGRASDLRDISQPPIRNLNVSRFRWPMDSKSACLLPIRCWPSRSKWPSAPMVDYGWPAARFIPMSNPVNRPMTRCWCSKTAMATAKPTKRRSSPAGC